MCADISDQLASAVSNRGLKLIVNTSEKCNLRCTYCYETFTVGHMRRDVAEGIVQLVRRRAADGLDRLELEFFGGEPLASWRNIEYIARNLREACEQYDVHLVGGMTTNATLLSIDRLDFLLRNKINAFQITLDGPRDIHNKRRVSPAGGSTFDAIWRRLMEMRASKFNNLLVTVRIHFDAFSWPFLVERGGLIDELSAAFLRVDRRFTLQFNPLERWATHIVDDINYFPDHREARAVLQRLLSHAKELGLSPLQVPQLAQSAVVGESGHAVCYASRANAYVVRADGRLSKCTVAFDDDRNVVGRITRDGDMIINHAAHIAWLRGLISGEASELACPAVGYIWPK